LNTFKFQNFEIKQQLEQISAMQLQLPAIVEERILLRRQAGETAEMLRTAELKVCVRESARARARAHECECVCVRVCVRECE
jgi:hypothetical protein